MTQAASDPAAVNRRITTLSVSVAVILVTAKAFAYGASGSVSILASLTDSALDLVASLATFFAVRWAAAAPDAEHRYGHGKAESLAALVQSGLVAASAVFIGLEAVRRIFNPVAVSGGQWAVGVMVFSMALTGWLIWQQGRALKASGSVAIEGDRAHYAADLAANAVVLIGVVSGSFLRAPGLDAAAGLVVAVWLGWGAVGIARTAASHLLDAAAPDEDRNAVVAAVLEDPRISNVHQLRTRIAGSTLMVQMHVDLDAKLSLVDAHDIVVAAEKRVLARFPNADIIIHADPHPVPHGHMRDDHLDIPSPREGGPWG
ncbi:MULTISPECIES: cation diffusion facilitator family transporter [unclassified Brevundimonas]|uniref:cation diffusion facilitator family transporter n=1 Tax=unclassified Brevundimonas TaxID=2622653 RepID=UPI0025C30633|nr:MULTISPECIES: cation diffusion facilitator family transporter [unclassified Brevundimonas]